MLTPKLILLKDRQVRSLKTTQKQHFISKSESEAFQMLSTQLLLVMLTKLKILKGSDEEDKACLVIKIAIKHDVTT